MDKFDEYYKDYYSNWNQLLEGYNVNGIGKEQNLDAFKESIRKKKSLTLNKK